MRVFAPQHCVKRMGLVDLNAQSEGRLAAKASLSEIFKVYESVVWKG